MKLLLLSFGRGSGLDHFRQTFSHLPTKNLPTTVRNALEAYDIVMSGQVIGGLDLNDVANRDPGLDGNPVIMVVETTTRACGNNELVVSIDDRLYQRLISYTRRENCSLLGLVNDAIALLRYASTQDEVAN
ncbi:MAG: hypothetical protein NUV56_00040 [Candidatus Uhrbacteria bacterium]|nr:hypothetical protein [Candidatus Uhrbacteria bacterium]